MYFVWIFKYLSEYQIKRKKETKTLYGQGSKYETACNSKRCMRNLNNVIYITASSGVLNTMLNHIIALLKWLWFFFENQI